RPEQGATGGGVAPPCSLAHGLSTKFPLPLWERDRVRGLAPAGADERNAGKRTRINLNRVSSRCRASPLTLSLSHKGRGDSVGRPCVKRADVGASTHKFLPRFYRSLHSRKES